jgi:hypothetical protein
MAAALLSEIDDNPSQRQMLGVYSFGAQQLGYALLQPCGLIQPLENLRDDIFAVLDITIH